jgi:hypothetical protein
VSEPRSLAREVLRVFLRSVMAGISAFSLRSLLDRRFATTASLEVAVELASVAGLGAIVEAVAGRFPPSRRRDLLALLVLAPVTLLGVFPAQWQWAYLEGLAATGKPSGALAAVYQRVSHFPDFQPADGSLFIFYAAAVTALGFARLRGYGAVNQGLVGVLGATAFAAAASAAFELLPRDPTGVLIFMLGASALLAITASAVDAIDRAIGAWSEAA